MATITHSPDHHHHHQFLIPQKRPKFDLLVPLRRWVDGIEVCDRRFAHLVCTVIPCCCPFERNINLLGHTYHIPPLCKLNPLYNELVNLRFRALSYLADACCEDIQKYIC